MKSILISTIVLLGLSAAAMADFNPDYILKIYETARSEGIVFDENSIKPVEGSSRATLSCPSPSPGTSTSVHALKPQDIQVIGAIGDSLTAANGAKANSILGLMDECRGVSWSIGCESSLDKTLTFASILKHLNSNLYGCSSGTGNQNKTSVAYLNLAHPGETSFEMLGQAKMLVSRLRSSVADADNKWKLINFFIGGNDLCEACEKDRQKPENFLKNIRETLDYFEANLPRTVVNLVLTLDVTGIEILSGFTCRNMQNSFCSCALNDKFRTQIKTLTAAYQKDAADLINSGRYDNNPLFTVVLHSFMTKMTPPLTSGGKPDYSYFAPDCFHFSVKGHETAAVELWNSMLTPTQSRSDKWTIGQSIKCPTLTSPYIFTRKTTTSLKTLLSN